MIFFEILWIALLGYSTDYSCSITSSTSGNLIEIRKGAMTVKTYVYSCELFKGVNKPKEAYLVLSELDKQSFRCPTSNEFNRYPGGQMYERRESDFTPLEQ